MCSVPYAIAEEGSSIQNTMPPSPLVDHVEVLIKAEQASRGIGLHGARRRVSLRPARARPGRAHPWARDAEREAVVDNEDGGRIRE